MARWKTWWSLWIYHRCKSTDTTYIRNRCVTGREVHTIISHLRGSKRIFRIVEVYILASIQIWSGGTTIFSDVTHHHLSEQSSEDIRDEIIYPPLGENEVGIYHREITRSSSMHYESSMINISSMRTVHQDRQREVHQGSACHSYINRKRRSW